MPKYEIMFLVDPECTQIESESEVEPLLEIFRGEKDFRMSVSWSDSLAYPIKKKVQAHRYLINFETDEREKLKNFKTLSNLNSKILRYLIINLEKDYGYKSSINPKKIKMAQERARRFAELRNKRQKVFELKGIEKENT